MFTRKVFRTNNRGIQDFSEGVICGYAANYTLNTSYRVASGVLVNALGEKNAALAKPVARRYNKAMEQSPILVVEDVKSIRDLIAAALRLRGYKVITSSNGREAIEALYSNNPALIISDIMMPEMDGYELAYQLRTQEEHSDIPILFLSATYTDPEDVDFAMSLGAVQFLEKPVDTEDLLLTITEIILGHKEKNNTIIDRDTFSQLYRERLTQKLRHKNTQIGRTERLLQTLPATQQPAFREMLKELAEQRAEIQKRLEAIKTNYENDVSG